MIRNKSIFISLVLIIVCVFVWLGYVYYYSTRPLKVIASPYKIMPDNQPKSISHSDITTLPIITKTTSSIVNKTTIKQDYQPTETERLFYRRVVESLKPKQIPKDSGGRISEGGINWKRETYKAFPSREPLYPGETKQYDDSASHSKQYYQEMSTSLYELIKQYLDSPYHLFYQETFDLIIQMQKEDEDFYDKYDINKTGYTWSDVCYRGTVPYPNTVPLDEKINGYIHCLRYSYFYKTNQYKMEFGLGDGMGGFDIPCNDPILSGAKLVGIGIPAVPSLLNILEDRKPIIVADDTKIPAVFYRYQDAAIEILQRMFIKAKQPFPVQLTETQYFSEYLEEQTPETKQKVISDIKTWVEENMKNTTKPEEPTPSPK